MAQFHVRVVTCLTVLALISSFSACRSVDQVVQSNYLLNTAYDRISEGEYVVGIDTLETLLADLEPRKEQFVRQRFYAYYLLTQAHILQALKDRRAVPEDKQESYKLNPRVLSAMLYIGNVLDTIDAAEASPRTSETGEQLVPSRLEAIKLEEIRTQMDLLSVGFYGGLYFSDKMRILVNRFRDLGDLTKLDSCNKLLESSHVVGGVYPWIQVGVHRYLRRSDPKEAFRFAISALHGEHPMPNQLIRAELIGWINKGSNFKFLCNKCDEQVVPDRPTCWNCGTTYLTAYGVEKDAGAGEE